MNPCDSCGAPTYRPMQATGYNVVRCDEKAIIRERIDELTPEILQGFACDVADSFAQPDIVRRYLHELFGDTNAP